MKSLRCAATAIFLLFSAGSSFGQFAATRADAGIDSRAASEPLVSSQFSPVEESTSNLTDYAPPSTGDLDLGIQRLLKKTEVEKAFWASVDLSFLATTNAFYTPENEQDDLYADARIAFGYRPKLFGNWYLDASLSQDFIRYDDFSELDYEVFDGKLGVVRLMPEVWNSVLVVSYDYQRVTLGGINEDFYARQSISAGLQKRFALTRFQHIAVGLGTSIDVAIDEEVLQRNEYVFQALYENHFVGDWHGKVFYNALYRDYTEFDRDDLTQIVGLGVSYRPKDWLQIDLTASYANSDSNIDALDYEAGVFGAGVALRATF